MIKKLKKVKLVNHTNTPYDNGAIGAVASVGVSGAAAGAAVGVAAELSGIAAGAAIGGAIGVAGAIAGIEAIRHLSDKDESKK